MEDNARPHATTLTQTYLKDRYIQKIKCPLNHMIKNEEGDFKAEESV